MARDLKTYSPAEIHERLASTPGWTLGEDGYLHRELTFKNFMQAVLFTNAVAHLAQVADHHPDLCLHDYKQLAIRLRTHHEGGITDKDFALLDQIERLPRGE